MAKLMWGNHFQPLIFASKLEHLQGKARQGKARQGKARQGKARQDKARQGTAGARRH
jgi:hypothetical protein